MDTILENQLTLRIHLFKKPKMEISFQNGFKNFMMATIASTDSSSWSKEINIWNLIEMININWFISKEDIWLIWNKIFNSKSAILQDKDKLFLKKIFNKMSKFKDQLAQADSMQITFNSKQIKIKLTSQIRYKSKYIYII